MRKRKRHMFARYNEPNPMKPETEAIIIGGVGLLLAAGLGYYLYTKSQASSTAAATTSTTSSTATPAEWGTTPVGTAPGQVAPPVPGAFG